MYIIPFLREPAKSNAVGSDFSSNVIGPGS